MDSTDIPSRITGRTVLYHEVLERMRTTLPIPSEELAERFVLWVGRKKSCNSIDNKNGSYVLKFTMINMMMFR